MTLYIDLNTQSVTLNHTAQNIIREPSQVILKVYCEDFLTHKIRQYSPQAEIYELAAYFNIIQGLLSQSERLIPDDFLPLLFCYFN